MKYLRGLGAAAAVLCAVGLLLPMGTAFAEEEEDSSSTFDDGTLTYTILNGTQVAVTDCTTSATNISIMPEIDGYDIVAIGDEAFANCTELMSLTIPSSVTSIGESAFYGCTSLEALTIPDGVTELESGTFFQCSSLSDLDLGSGVQSFGDMVFGYCTSLTELTLPDTLETMGNQTFYYCASLEHITIPEKVTEIGSYAFYGCLSLTNFTVPQQIETIGAMAFLGCPSLATISVEEGNAHYVAVDNVLYDTEQSILYLYPPARTDTTFTVPDDVLVIYAGAFFAAENLTQITFNDTLQYIGEMAFDFCSGLTSLTIPESVTTISSTAFADCTGLTEVTFVGADAEDGGEGEPLEIESFAFYCCDNLMTVRLPKRVSEIGQYAFGCTAPAEDETDSESVVTVTSDSGSTLQVKALEGFQLVGYTGAAADYVKESDVDIDFDTVNFDWQAFGFWAILCAVGVLVLAIAVLVVRRTMATAGERRAKRAQQAAEAAKRAQEEAEHPTFDDGYRSIVDDEPDEPDEVLPYEETLDHAQLHHRGHADSEEADEKP